MKKIKSIILVLCLSLLSTSCSSEKASSKETTLIDDAATVAETESHSNVPDDLQFDGNTFSMVCSDFNEYHYSIVEEQNGEVLNDAKYKMTLDTEDKLNVDIVEVPFAVHSMAQMIINNVLAGDDTYDAVTHLDRYTVNMMLGGALTPLNNVKYLDLSADYWNPQITNMFSLGGKSYYALSSYNMLSLVYTSCIYFNSDLLADLGNSSDELYKLVNDGKWTYDKQLEYMELATSDINGDTKMDENDRFGLVTYDSTCFGNSILGGLNEFSFIKNEKNEIELSWDNEKFNNAMEMVYDLYNNKGTWTKSERYTSNMFTSGNALFMSGYFYAISTLSDMADDYGIIPFPKYNESQENYCCEAYDAMYTSIPLSASDCDYSGAVLEELSYSGYNNVIDAYIESTMKYKKTRDQQSIDMIQLCIDSRVIDLASIYADDIAGYNSMQQITNRSSYDFASYAASKKNIAEKRISEIYEAIKQNSKS